MFEFNLFEVGNAMTLGLIEEILESQVKDMLDDIHINFPEIISEEDFFNELAKFDINWKELPEYLQEYIIDCL